MECIKRCVPIESRNVLKENLKANMEYVLYGIY